MIKTYFAMPVTYYFDTILENDVKFLNLFGLDLYIPNSEIDDAGYKSQGMKYFKDLIVNKAFKLLVFRSFDNTQSHNISAGVADEACYALNVDIPVLELIQNKKGKLRLQAINMVDIQRRACSIKQTRLMLEHIRSNSNCINGLGITKAIL